MLKEILQYIYETRVYSKSKISQNLNVSEEMVESAVDQLLQMNFIKEDETSPTCGNVCSGCPIQTCNRELVKTFTITEKGRKTLGI